jgi:beta-ureidopropionase
MYGHNQGQPVQAVELPPGVQAAAQAQGFDAQAYAFKAAQEQLRPPRLVRIALIQHGIVKPTTAPFAEQRQVRGGGTAPRTARLAAQAGTLVHLAPALPRG